jgi:nitroreductase
LELFVDYGQRHGKSDEELVLERERAVQAPVVIAIVARIDPSARVPAHEQWIAVGGAVANLLNALHFMGFGAKTLSGLRASDPEITKEFCRENEQLVGWVSVGTPKTRPASRAADPVDRIFSEF